jgi:hypothetical protein
MQGQERRAVHMSFMFQGEKFSKKKKNSRYLGLYVLRDEYAVLQTLILN